MSRLSRAGFFLSAALIVACTGGQPTTPPSTPLPTSPPVATAAPSTGAPSAAPGTSTPSTEPGASLDPSLSDAGVVARVTLVNDTRGSRDGTHDIVGIAGDGFGSGCSNSFEGDEYTAVASYDGAANGQLLRLSVTIPSDDVPPTDGQTLDISGRVSFDFRSESGVGTLYTGDASGDNDGRSSIDVTRTGTRLDLTFEGATWDNVTFTGVAACAET